MTSWDAWGFWMTKAKAIYYFGGIDTSIFRQTWPSYPLLVPVLAAMNFRFMSGRHDRARGAMVAARRRLRLGDRRAPTQGGAAARDGLRAFRRSRILELGLPSPGMEYASEMVIKASLAGLRITEVPTMLSSGRDGRVPRLRPWRDGWRHLRLLLLYSPRWLFLYPGLVFGGFGLSATIALVPPGRS